MQLLGMYLNREAAMLEGVVIRKTLWIDNGVSSYKFQSMAIKRILKIK